MTREVYDDWGNVYVERYDADGEMIGDVERQDLEGWVFDDCTGEEVAGVWTDTCTKYRVVDDDGNTETEVEVFTYPTYDDPNMGTAAHYGTQICSYVTRTFIDQSTEEFERTCDGYRV